MRAATDQLVADIGATHARFALAREGVTADRTVLPTGDFGQAPDLVRAAMTALSVTRVDEACFAVAGPVAAGAVEITNGGLAFSERELAGVLGAPVALINDFHALALAVPELAQLERIGGDPDRGRLPAVKALLGPGSGLGMSMLVPDAGDGWTVLPSEGGHADLAPGNPLEQELLTVLQSKHESVCWETVLSGPGLVNLYQAVATMWGITPEPLGPEVISARGVDAEDPVCHQTLELFFALLGSAAGNLALTVCAYAGVYIGGGIVPGLVEFARTSPMRRRFEERSAHGALVADIPLYLILDEHPGLTGALAWLKRYSVSGT